MPFVCDFTWLIKYLSNIKLQNVRLFPQKVADWWGCAAKIAMNELFDVSSRRCEHTEDHQVVGHNLSVQSVNFLFSD